MNPSKDIQNWSTIVQEVGYILLDMLLNYYHISDNLSSALGDIIIAEVPENPERSNTGNDNGKILYPKNIKSRTSTYLTYRFLEHSNRVIEVTHKYLEKNSITCRLEYLDSILYTLIILPLPIDL